MDVFFLSSAEIFIFCLKMEKGTGWVLVRLLCNCHWLSRREVRIDVAERRDKNPFLVFCLSVPLFVSFFVSLLSLSLFSLFIDQPLDALLLRWFCNHETNFMEISNTRKHTWRERERVKCSRGLILSIWLSEI